jgi:cytochrome c oxidase subunit 4
MTDHHGAAPARYFIVYAALLALTFTTYGVAYVPLGQWHVAVALGIAVIKATLVVLIFMHLSESSKLTRLVVASGLFTLALFVSLTLADYWTRSWIGQRPLSDSPTSVWFERNP